MALDIRTRLARFGSPTIGDRLSGLARLLGHFGSADRASRAPVAGSLACPVVEDRFQARTPFARR